MHVDDGVLPQGHRVGRDRDRPALGGGGAALGDQDGGRCRGRHGSRIDVDLAAAGGDPHADEPARRQPEGSEAEHGAARRPALAAGPQLDGAEGHHGRTRRGEQHDEGPEPASRGEVDVEAQPPHLGRLAGEARGADGDGIVGADLVEERSVVHPEGAAPVEVTEHEVVDDPPAPPSDALVALGGAHDAGALVHRCERVDGTHPRRSDEDGARRQQPHGAERAGARRGALAPPTFDGDDRDRRRERPRRARALTGLGRGDGCGAAPSRRSASGVARRARGRARPRSGRDRVRWFPGSRGSGRSWWPGRGGRGAPPGVRARAPRRRQRLRGEAGRAPSAEQRPGAQRDDHHQRRGDQEVVGRRARARAEGVEAHRASIAPARRDATGGGG